MEVSNFAKAINIFVMDAIRQWEQEQINKIREEKQIPMFGPGDTVKVHYRIIEGDKERIQPFTGVVIQIKNSGLNTTFTVRKISEGIGVERIFPLYSPRIEKIEVLRRGHPRRARLFYLREKVGRDTRIRERKNDKYPL